MQLQRERDTAPELALRRELHRRGLRYRVDRQIVPGTRRRVDIVFGSAKVAVFVDGCFWHRCPDHGVIPKSNPEYWIPKFQRNGERDRETACLLAADGWDVVRVWEHEPVESAAERIEAAVRGKRS